MSHKTFKRGEIWYADLSPVVGAEQGGQRPVLIVQNNVGNHFSPTVIVAPITTALEKKSLPTHVPITTQISGIPKNSVILAEQLRTIDKQRLMNQIGHLPQSLMTAVNHSLQISLGLLD